VKNRGFRRGDIRAQNDCETTGGVSFGTVGVDGGSIDLIIIDALIWVRGDANSEGWRARIFDWYANDIYIHLEPDGAIIHIQTR